MRLIKRIRTIKEYLEMKKHGFSQIEDILAHVVDINNNCKQVPTQIILNIIIYKKKHLFFTKLKLQLKVHNFDFNKNDNIHKNEVQDIR